MWIVFLLALAAIYGCKRGRDHWHSKLPGERNYVAVHDGTDPSFMKGLFGVGIWFFALIAILILVSSAENPYG